MASNDAVIKRFAKLDTINNIILDYKKFFIDVIQDYQLPLIPIESKSGGLHLCLFMDHFTDAKAVKSFLSNLLPLFKLKPDCEVFPKQTELTTDEETGNLKPGQFINLPYYGGKRRALNVDGTPFDIEKFLKLVEANLVSKENLTKITDSIDQKIYDGIDGDLLDGPPCLALCSKTKLDDGRDRFMYNYHVMVKMKYQDNWQQRVMNAPVKYFAGVHANAWDQKFLNQKVKSWNKSTKGLSLIHI